VLRCSGEDIQTEPAIGYGVCLNKRANRLIREGYPKFDGFISIIGSITRRLLEMGIPDDKIEYIPNGIDKGLFDMAVTPGEVKRSLGIAPEKKVILTVGRNHPKKGFKYIPDMIEALSQKRDDFIWLLIGLFNEPIKEAVDRRGLGRFLMKMDAITDDGDGGRVIIPSKRLVAIYKSADVLALPTAIEGRSNVIAEAMAAALPVASTDAEGVRDMIESGRTGLLSGKGDAPAMATNISRIFDDAGLRESIKAGAIKETEGLEWPKVAARYAEAYRKAIKRKR
jgi:glycosyltransferase involved in cell wall biosynthesis